VQCTAWSLGCTSCAVRLVRPHYRLCLQPDLTSAAVAARVGRADLILHPLGHAGTHASSTAFSLSWSVRMSAGLPAACTRLSILFSKSKPLENTPNPGWNPRLCGPPCKAIRQASGCYQRCVRLVTLCVYMCIKLSILEFTCAWHPRDTTFTFTANAGVVSKFCPGQMYSVKVCERDSAGSSWWYAPSAYVGRIPNSHTSPSKLTGSPALFRSTFPTDAWLC
jgi:hypothetical protein